MTSDRFQLYAEKIKYILASKLSNLNSCAFSSEGEAVKENNNSGVEVLCVKLASRAELAFHAASVLYRAKVQSNNAQFELIVKAMPLNPIQRLLLNSTEQFYNETKFYFDIVPTMLSLCKPKDFAGDCVHLVAATRLFPRCYYSAFQEENALVVLEDLGAAGYTISGGKDMLMDYEHVIVAVRGLARFHALSYGAKKKNFSTFEETVIKGIHDSRRIFTDVDTTFETSPSHYVFLRHATKLLLETYRKERLQPSNSSYRTKFHLLYEKITSLSGLINLIQDLLRQEEPYSVLCHGDFNMNNMMFKQSDTMEVKFLDFQSLAYCSPMIDLCFMLFVNCSPDMRADKWDTLFRTYHATLLDSLSEFLNCSLKSLELEFNLDAFQHQYSRFCLFGFIFAAPFIHARTLNPGDDDVFDKFEGDRMPSVAELEVNLAKEMPLENEDLKKRLFSLVDQVLQGWQP